MGKNNMNILIIGNGFDLAHNLPTQYSDFLDFVKSYKMPDNSNYSEFLEDLKSKEGDLYLEIGELIQSNVLLDYFISVYEERLKEGKKGWIDFENEISVFVQNLDEAKQYVEKAYNESHKPVLLKRGVEERLSPIIYAHKPNEQNMVAQGHQFEPRYFDYQANRLLDSLKRLTRLLEIYLFEYVEKLDNNYIISDLDDCKIDKVISFNYTITYKKKYDPEEKEDYCYIHGQVKNGSAEECDIVLGIDEYLPPSRIDSDNQFVWFKKFYQRIYKQTSSEYLDWIKNVEDYNERCSKANPSRINLYIYGHSLDVTDKDVLSRLILMDNTITHIYYHNREAMAKQISNLIKVIGEDNLIKKTGGKDRTIIFVKSSEAVLGKLEN